MDWLSSISELFRSAIPLLDRAPFIRAIVGFILVFFLPGFTWSIVFFKQIKILERIALSFGLSIAIVTLSVLFTNKLLGVRVTGSSALVIIVLITSFPVGLHYVKKRLLKKNQH